MDGEQGWDGGRWAGEGIGSFILDGGMRRAFCARGSTEQEEVWSLEGGRHWPGHHGSGRDWVFRAAQQIPLDQVRHMASDHVTNNA